MSSCKQNAANRRNAQKSTGPRTVEGKRIAKSNAVKHGMTAKDIAVLHTIDGERLKSFYRLNVAQFNPVGAYEEHLVSRLTRQDMLLWLVDLAQEGVLGEVPSQLDYFQGTEAPGPLRNSTALSIAMGEFVRGAEGEAFAKTQRYQASIAKQRIQVLQELLFAQERRQSGEEVFLDSEHGDSRDRSNIVRLQTPGETASLSGRKRPQLRKRNSG